MKTRDFVCAVAALCVSACACFPACAQSGHGYLTWVGSGTERIPVVVVGGTPYEMGAEYGALMAPGIEEFVGQLADFFAQTEYNDVLDAAWDATSPYTDGRYQQEIMGVADGAGIDVQDLRRVHAMMIADTYSCSSIAAWGAATLDGHLYQTRDLDWDMGIGAHYYPLIVLYLPAQGVAHVNIGFAGLVGSHTGMNMEGIVLAEMGDSPSSEMPYDMEGTHFMPLFRNILYDAHSLTEALGILSGAQRIKRYHYVFGDGRHELRAVKILAHAPETPPNDLIVWTDNDPTDELFPDVIDQVVYEDEGRGAFPFIYRYWSELNAGKMIELANSIPILGDNVVNVVYDATALEFWCAYAEGDEEAYTQPYVRVKPLAMDGDGDGIPDVTEGGGDTDQDGTPDFMDADSDDDGLEDAFEYAYGLDPLDFEGGNGPLGDPDQDGRNNLQEFTEGTDPRAADSPSVEPGIVFPDIQLEAAIREAIGQPSGAIQAASLEALVELDASFWGIEDLTGLEHCVNLTWLNLRSNFITALGPLAHLTSLTWLSLGDNYIDDVSPLSSLVHLTELQLWLNYVHDAGPLAGLTGLESLDLGANPDLSDLTPLAGLTALWELDLEEDSVEDLGPLAGLENLTTLFLADNYISDINPLSNLTGLQELDLSSNFISEIAPLSGLSSLQYLNLYFNEVADVGPLSGLSNLQELDLGNNFLTDIQGLSGLSSLAYLYLDSNGIANVTALSNLQGLAVLWLNNNLVDDASPLSALSDLQELDLGGNGISDLRPLSGLTHLYALYLGYNDISSVTPLASLVLLEDLDLGANQISDAGPLAGMDNLSRLWLDQNLISDLTPLSGLYNLYDLWLDSNQIADVTPLSSLWYLNHLSLGNNSISDITPLAWLWWLGELSIENNEVGDISPLAGLTELWHLELGDNLVADIRPLSGLGNLEQLGLEFNGIDDLGPLTGLWNLSEIRLTGNEVSEVGPLVANPGLGEGDALYLNYNPLSATACDTDLPALQERGVYVESACTEVPPSGGWIRVAETSDKVLGETDAIDLYYYGGAEIGVPGIIVSWVSDPDSSDWWVPRAFGQYTIDAMTGYALATVLGIYDSAGLYIPLAEKAVFTNTIDFTVGDDTLTINEVTGEGPLVYTPGVYTQAAAHIADLVPSVPEGEEPCEGEGETEEEGEPDNGAGDQDEGECEGESGDPTPNPWDARRIAEIRSALLRQFDALDENRDGGLSFAEARARFTDLTLEQFGILDDDGNRRLSREELGFTPAPAAGCFAKANTKQARQTWDDGVLWGMSLAVLMALRRIKMF